MEVDQAENRLRQLLSVSSFDFDAPNPMLGWQVFKDFVQEPVVTFDDGVLFQAGVYEFTGSEQFHFDFTRQFSIHDAKDEYDHMEQLSLLFLCDPNEKLRQIKTNRWAYDFPSLEAFFAEVESMDAFQSAMTINQWRCRVSQWDV